MVILQFMRKLKEGMLKLVLSICSLLTIRLSEYEKDNTTLPNDIAGVVFKYYARSGGEEEGKKLIEIAEKISSSPSSSPELVIASLACIGYGANIEQYLK
jgi:hypothetical protein